MSKEKFKILKAKTINYIKKFNLVSYLFIGIACFCLCLLLAAQIKAISDTSQLAQGKREAQLIDDLKNLTNKYSDLKEKFEENSLVVEEYKNNSATSNSLIASMKSEIEQLSSISGTANLKGEGIVITLEDGDFKESVEDRADALVHDSDILTVVNELKAAGAEAISVNGQRIIATSAIRCVGPVIQVNYQKVAAPFTIKAIGDAQYLESAMTIKNGVTDMLEYAGVKVNIKRLADIRIDKFDGTINLKNATLAN